MVYSFKVKRKKFQVWYTFAFPLNQYLVSSILAAKVAVSLLKQVSVSIWTSTD